MIKEGIVFINEKVNSVQFQQAFVLENDIKKIFMRMEKHHEKSLEVRTPSKANGSFSSLAIDEPLRWK